MSEKKAKRRSFGSGCGSAGGRRRCPGLEFGENSEIRPELTCESPKHAGTCLRQGAANAGKHACSMLGGLVGAQDLNRGMCGGEAP